MMPARHPIPAVRGELPLEPGRDRPAHVVRQAFRRQRASQGLEALSSRSWAFSPAEGKESVDGSIPAGSVCARSSSGNGGRIAVPRMFRGCSAGCSVDVPWMFRGCSAGCSAGCSVDVPRDDPRALASREQSEAVRAPLPNVCVYARRRPARIIGAQVGELARDDHQPYQARGSRPGRVNTLLTHIRRTFGALRR